MKTTFLKYILFSLSVLFFYSSCDDDNLNTPTGPTGPTHGGIFILNEGAWTQNNASLTYYNYKTNDSIIDIFNGRLGDTAQDMIIYGGKLYITVSESNTIAVVDVNTLEELQYIPLQLEDKNFTKPRYLEAYKGKIYTSIYEGYVVKIDTTNLKIEAAVEVGRNPEGIVAYQDELFVANSGGMDFLSPDKTLSIINLNTFKEKEKVEVGTNPYRLKADNKGNIYLTYQGIYGVSSGGFQHYNIATKEVKDIASYPKQDFVLSNDLIYYYDVTYDDMGNYTHTLGLYDTEKQAFLTESFIKDGTIIQGKPYGIGVHPLDKDVYLAISNSRDRGDVYIFDESGKFKQNLKAGINPNKVIFY